MQTGIGLVLNLGGVRQEIAVQSVDHDILLKPELGWQGGRNTKRYKTA